MTTGIPRPAQLQGLARRRLEQRRRAQPETCEEIERLRAQGYVVIGGPTGYVVLPAEQD